MVVVTKFFSMGPQPMPSPPVPPIGNAENFPPEVQDEVKVQQQRLSAIGIVPEEDATAPAFEPVNQSLTFEGFWKEMN